MKLKPISKIAKVSSVIIGGGGVGFLFRELSTEENPIYITSNTPIRAPRYKPNQLEILSSYKDLNSLSFDLWKVQRQSTIEKYRSNQDENLKISSIDTNSTRLFEEVDKWCALDSLNTGNEEKRKAWCSDDLQIKSMGLNLKEDFGRELIHEHNSFSYEEVAKIKEIWNTSKNGIENKWNNNKSNSQNMKEIKEWCSKVLDYFNMIDLEINEIQEIEKRCTIPD